MQNWFRFSLCLIVSLSFLAPRSHSQAIFAATESGHIQVGAGAMYLNTDYGNNTNKGVAFWADYDFRRHLGVELEGHLGGIISPGDIGENSYLVGPRVSFYKRHMNVYGKLLVGQAKITNQFLNQSSSFNVYAFGGGVDYKISRRINLRVADVEMQKWPDFEPHTLSPLSVTIGASYIIR